MKYMLMIYGNEELWESFPAEEFAADRHGHQRAAGRAPGVRRVRRRLRRRRPGAGQDGDAGRRRAGRSPTAPTSRPRSTSAASTSSTSRAWSARSRSRRGCRSPGSAQVEVRPLMHEAAGQRVSDAPTTEDLLRELAPQVLGALVRRYGHFDACRGRGAGGAARGGRAVAGAGPPGQPGGWLIDGGGAPADRPAPQRRGPPAPRGRDRRRRDRPRRATSRTPRRTVTDDTLTLLFLCCHPALSPASQLALTLRAVGGLTTAEIARAFLVPEATMAQRISRAKQSIKAAGAHVRAPARRRARRRLRVVLHVLYLMFNEGYTTSSGDDLQRADLTAEAIRLTRAAARHAPGRRRGRRACSRSCCSPTPAGRPAHRADGALVPLDEQDRTPLGPRPRSPRASRSSPHALAPRAARSVPAAGRDRRGARRGAVAGSTPTGRRSSRSTSCSTASRPTRWPRSTGRSRSPRSHGPQAGARPAGVARRRRPHRRAPPTLRGARPPARDGRRPDGGPRRPTATAARRTTSTPRAAPPRSPRRPAQLKRLTPTPRARSPRWRARRGTRACGRGSPSAGCGSGSRRRRMRRRSRRDPPPGSRRG